MPVVSVQDFAGSAYIERDLALISIGVGPDKRGDVIEIVNLFRGRIVDVGPESVVVEIAGTEEKIDAFTELMRPFEIRELAQTGVIAMTRGMQSEKYKAAQEAGPKKRTRSIDAPAAASLPPS